MVDRDELLRRVDLHALLDELSPAPAIRLGPTARWRCIDPGHDDQHPSVTMHIDRRGIPRWRCWSGGHGGTAIDALLVARGLTVAQAIEELGQRSGLELDRGPVERRPGAVPRAPIPLDPTVRRYAEACERILWTRTGRPVLEWLTEQRRLPNDVLRANHVGADPGPDVLSRSAGLPGGGLAAVFPALTPAGEIAYLQARYLDPPDGRSKYDNPSSRLGTNPRLAWTRTTRTPEPGVLLVCEGVPDALCAAAAGYAAVGVLGATGPDERVAERLAHQAAGRRLVLAFDGDPAGRGASEQLERMLHRFDLQVEQLSVPDGMDLNALHNADPRWLPAALGVRHHEAQPVAPRHLARSLG